MGVNLMYCVLVVIGCATFQQGPVLGADVNVIVGSDLMYYPQQIEINVGDTIVWRWAYPAIPVPGGTPHTVTKSLSFEKRCDFVKNDQKEAMGIDFNSGYQVSGYVFNVTFTKPEVVTYHCETTGVTSINCNLGMWGQVIVKEYGANTEIIDLSKYKLQPGIVASIYDKTPVNKIASTLGGSFASIFGVKNGD